MEDTISRILVTSVVRKALKDMKESPERAARNLVDMALRFSEGQFQQRFFSTAQTMLENENSGYYGLIRNTMSYVDTERLFTFGMNLGYNGCTVGAKVIREREKIQGFNIPWTVVLRLEEQTCEEHREHYRDLIRQGEEMGIWVWMLFSSGSAQSALQMAQEHPDSAFFLFCEEGDLTAECLDQASEVRNMMIVLRYDETITDVCAQMRDMGLLYSVWYEYGAEDTQAVLNGDLFYSAQQMMPVFTVLVPGGDCPESVQRLVHQTAASVRGDQNYRTIPWEMRGDNEWMDAIISDDSCSVTFEWDGSLAGEKRSSSGSTFNLFEHSLEDVLRQMYPKEKDA